MAYGRRNRWSWLGLVNEPCFTEARGPDKDRFGLWLDQRDPSCPPDPFADPAKYPGVQIRARGKTVPTGSYYGEPSGVMGLRLFPNPDFDASAQARWDPERYYNDRSYYNDRNLVRPYRVGMSCAFCHVGPSAISPPARPGKSEMGEPGVEPRRSILLGQSHLLLEHAATRRRQCPAPNEGTFCTNCSIPIHPAAWIRRSSRPIT